MSDNGPGGAAEGTPPAWRRWLPAAVGLLTMALFAASIWYAYEEGRRAGAARELPLIKADPAPVKRKPEDPGGMQVANQDRLIFERVSPGPVGTHAERLLPPPEEPVAPPPAPFAAGPDPEVAGREAGGPTAPPPSVETAPDPGAAGEDAPEGAPEPVEETAGAANGPGAPAETAPRPQPPTPRSKPAAPAPPATAAPAPQTAAAAPDNAASAADGWRLQLASFQEAAAADAAWRKLTARHTALLRDLRPNVVRVNLPDGRGTWYRLQAGLFRSPEAARAACEKLKAQEQECLVVTAR